MQKSRFSAVEINSIIREHDAGVRVTELCRKRGMNGGAFYKCKARYGGSDVPQLRWLKDLELKHSRLKQMYDELSLTHEAFRDVVEERRTLTRAIRHELVSLMVTCHRVSVPQACRTARLRRPAYYAPRRRRNDEPGIQAIQAFVADSQQQGFDRLYPVVHAQGFGRHRLHRVYKALKLNMKRKGKHRLPSRVKVPWAIPPKANDPW